MKTLLPVCLLLASFGLARDPFPVDELWRTETFRKSITASYGVDARIEPPVDTEEQGELASVASIVESGDRAAAIRQLAGSFRLAESATLQFTLGNLLFEEGRIAEAIRRFERAVELHPTFRDAHRNLAVAQIETKAMASARPHLLRAVELGARDGTTMGLLGYVHSQRNHHQAALQAYRMAQLTQPEVVQWKRGEAHSLQAMGQSRQAEAIFAALVDEAPAKPELWIGLADAQIADAPDDALVSLEWARRMGGLTADGLHALASLYLQGGVGSEAADCLKESLRVSPPLADSKALGLTETALARGDFEAAEAMAALFPARSSTPALERVRALIDLKRGDRAAGAKRVEALIAKNPLDAQSLILLAQFRVAEGKSQEASLLYEQASRNEAHAAEAFRRHGELWVGLRDVDRAIQLLEKSEALRPDPGLRKYITLLRDR